jgi:hypothetical protein
MHGATGPTLFYAHREQICPLGRRLWARIFLGPKAWRRGGAGEFGEGSASPSGDICPPLGIEYTKLTRFAAASDPSITHTLSET